MLSNFNEMKKRMLDNKKPATKVAGFFTIKKFDARDNEKKYVRVEGKWNS